MKDDSASERDQSFGQMVFALRSTPGLTQEQLGSRLGVSLRTVRGWEAGDAYPKVGHLKALIVLVVESEAFATANPAEEIRTLWKAAHQKMWLDEHWLSVLLAQLPHFYIEEPVVKVLRPALTSRSVLLLPLDFEPLKPSEHEVRDVSKRLIWDKTQLRYAPREDLKRHPSLEAHYSRS